MYVYQIKTRKNDKVVYEAFEMKDLIKAIEEIAQCNVRIMKYEDIVNDFLEQVNGNMCFKLTLLDHVNNGLLPQKCDYLTSKDIERIFHGKGFIINILLSNGDSIGGYVTDNGDTIYTLNWLLRREDLKIEITKE